MSLQSSKTKTKIKILGRFISESTLWCILRCLGSQMLEWKPASSDRSKSNQITFLLGQRHRRQPGCRVLHTNMVCSSSYTVSPTMATMSIRKITTTVNRILSRGKGGGKRGSHRLSHWWEVPDLSCSNVYQSLNRGAVHPWVVLNWEPRKQLCFPFLLGAGKLGILHITRISHLKNFMHCLWFFCNVYS